MASGTLKETQMLMTDSFARRVREESVADHRDAERSEFMSAAFSGDVTRVEHAALVVQLQAVYAALDEAAARHRNDAVVGAFFDPALERGAAIQADLAALPPTAVPLMKPRVGDVGRPRGAAAEGRAAVVAHRCTRHLGDLSGGQAIAAKLQNNLGLTPTAGLALYQCPEIGPAPKFKEKYRELLDTAGWNEAQRSEFIAEVKRAYDLNTKMFISLDHLR